MNFKNLLDAITLETGFRMEGQIEGNRNAISDTTAGRRDYFCREVVQLRHNSGFTTAEQYRCIEAKHVIEAVAHKVDAYFRAMAREDKGFILHYSNGGKPLHCKTVYVRYGDARRAADKLNARSHGSENPYTVSSTRRYIADSRARLAFNIMSRTYVMESTGTPFSCSVSSETYWCS